MATPLVRQPGAFHLHFACNFAGRLIPPSVFLSYVPALAPAALSGELAIAVPALGTSQALLNGNHASIYFHGMPQLQEGGSGGSGSTDGSDSSSSSGTRGFSLRRHGDAFERLPGGAYRALGRVDDTMNLGGIKVSSGGESVAALVLVLVLSLS